MSAAKSRKPFAYAEEEEIDTELPEHLDEEGLYLHWPHPNKHMT